jgi:gliding motility-associated lipoprotein GldD
MLKIVFIAFIISILSYSCTHDYTPKPRGYFRIAFQKKTYHKLDSTALPYRFDVPEYSKVLPDNERITEPYWINVKIPAHKADIHISYKKINNNLAELLLDSHNLAYNHTIKADAINERIYVDPAKKIYGTIYEIDGNAASPLQFYLTDSTRNFLRGALYIREIPNIDSLRPVIDYLKPDVMRLIETTEWKR